MGQTESCTTSTHFQRPKQQFTSCSTTLCYRIRVPATGPAHAATSLATKRLTDAEDIFWKRPGQTGGHSDSSNFPSNSDMGGPTTKHQRVKHLHHHFLALPQWSRELLVVQFAPGWSDRFQSLLLIMPLYPHPAQRIHIFIRLVYP